VPFRWEIGSLPRTPDASPFASSVTAEASVWSSTLHIPSQFGECRSGGPGWRCRDRVLLPGITVISAMSGYLRAAFQDHLGGLSSGLSCWLCAGVRRGVGGLGERRFGTRADVGGRGDRWLVMNRSSVRFRQAAPRLTCAFGDLGRRNWWSIHLLVSVVGPVHRSEWIGRLSDGGQTSSRRRSWPASAAAGRR
jgi:hypothetical protein